MASFDDDLPIGGDFDMDRIIIDPDYRRRVLFHLRQDRLRAEAARCPPPLEAMAARRDD
ncbi:MAG TPA: hypothetical protein VF502_17875 [Stellaceae bacterium]